MLSARQGFASLREFVLRNGYETKAVVSDETSAIALTRLACGCASPDRISALRDRTVVLATARQIETVAALIQLDGEARRVILWPQDRPITQIDDVVASVHANEIVTTWPLGCACEDFAATREELNQAKTLAPVRDTQYVLFTSGTTNRPKMVLHTLESLSGHLWAEALKPIAGHENKVWCSFYDIRRYGGLQVALRAIFGGSSLVLCGQGDEKPAAFLARAGSARTTHVLGTPSHWRRALMSDAAGLISPAYVRLSGEVADQVILDQLVAQYPNADIVHAFASTEAGLAFEVADRKAGFPAAYVGGNSAANLAVQEGTLRVRSSRNAFGYLDGGVRPIADACGFVDTGDVVVQTRDRYYFSGRCDGTINVGGHKVHPEEVEAVINLHPNVQMSQVAGRASPITGAVIVARIVARPASVPAQQSNLEEEIRALCRRHLPAHKVPASVSFVTQLAVSPSGKLLRARA
jgi:acyl-coenzyme A synthetase/AMP-(fatty) acid ligase